MCLNPFGRQDILNKHMQICGKNQPVMSHFRKEFRKLLCWWKHNKHNKSIYNYAARNRVFREEFWKLLCWWQVRRTSTEADSDANARRGRGEEITHTVV